jgi:heme/copper-type cytochrome/quinol oxidase subunit 4
LLLRKDEGGAMNDLIFAGIIVLFFVVGGLYVGFCEKL